MQAVMTFEELHRRWNVTRCAFYRDPSPENEVKMDEAMAVYLQAKGAKLRRCMECGKLSEKLEQGECWHCSTEYQRLVVSVKRELVAWLS